MKIGSTHYVVRVEVTRVDQGTKETGDSSGYNKTEKPHRAATKVATVVIKGDELEQLKDRVVKHLELVEDISAIDEHDTGNTRRANDV